MEPQNVIESNTVLIGKLKIINNYKKNRNETKKENQMQRKGKAGQATWQKSHIIQALKLYDMKIKSGTK